MKSELLVIADQHAAVNTFPGLVPVSYTHLDVYKRQGVGSGERHGYHCKRIAARTGECAGGGAVRRVRALAAAAT